MIRFACPGCDARFTIDDDQAGKAGECPSCAARFRIPEARPRPESPPAQGPPAPEPGATPTAVCPHCQLAARVAAEDVGHPVACPGCGQTYTPGEAAPGAAILPTLRRRRRRRARDLDDEPPPQLRTIGSLLLVGGIYGLVHVVGVFGASSMACCACLAWPPWYGMVVWSILAIVRGSAYHAGTAAEAGRPRTLQICQVLCILNLDLVNCVLGVIGLTLSAAPEVQDYFGRYSRYADDE